MMRAIVAYLALFTILTGLLYPLCVTVAGQLLFPQQAQGSVVKRNSIIVGSALIGQDWNGMHYFWGRPSATVSHPYDAAVSSGSNLGPTNPALKARIVERIRKLRAAHANASQAIPVELVTTSASGLDPHISPAAAQFQIERVARARKISPRTVQTLVAKHTESRTFGILGEPRINVLRLNLALDALKPAQ